MCLKLYTIKTPDTIILLKPYKNPKLIKTTETEYKEWKGKKGWGKERLLI